MRPVAACANRCTCRLTAVVPVARPSAGSDPAYVPAGVEPDTNTATADKTGLSTRRPSIAVREGVALFDQCRLPSSVWKAATRSVLNRICANNVDVAAGRLVYTQWLNDRGGIEADLTVTRLSETAFMIVGGAETEVRDFYWLKRQIPDDAHCVLTNVTSSMGVLSVMGPKARDLLQSLTPADMSHAGFPFATSREIELGCLAMVRSLAHHLRGGAGLGALRADRVYAACV